MRQAKQSDDKTSAERGCAQARRRPGYQEAIPILTDTNSKKCTKPWTKDSRATPNSSARVRDKG